MPHVFRAGANHSQVVGLQSQLSRGHLYDCVGDRVAFAFQTIPLVIQPALVRLNCVDGRHFSLCLSRQGADLHLSWLGSSAAMGVLVYAIFAGVAGACAALFLLHGTGLSVGSAPATELLYGITLGPVIEEVIFRGAAFSVVYVTACSAKVLTRWRIGISAVLTSLLFVWSHTRSIGIPWIVIFSMGIAYALLRWRSNSTAAAALMHATYNGVIAVAMIHAAV